MDRRELLKVIALVTGSAMIGVDTLGFAAKVKPKQKPFSLSKEDIALLDELGDTIIPETSTPGAKATKIGEFMFVMVRDCYTEEQQSVFTKGIKKFEEESLKLYKKSFTKCSPAERLSFLTGLEKAPEPYYTLMKQLTIFGYFTSEIGATKALRNVPIPGRYDGAYPYKKGDRAFNQDV